MKTKIFLILIFLIVGFSFVYAEEQPQAKLHSSVEESKENGATTNQAKINPQPSEGTKVSFENAADNVQKQLEESLIDLNNLRDKIVKEKIPLSRKLSDLEDELVKARLDYQQKSRLLDSRTLDLSNLRTEIKSRQDEASYLSNLLGEYIRNFESRLHIAEIQRYSKDLDAAKLAPENTNLSQEEIFKKQAALVTTSIERLNEALGGSRFDGNAVVSSGMVQHGTFVLVGPAALFRSEDGKNIGTVEQRLGSLEPTVIAFDTPADTNAAGKVITDSKGHFPLDPTLGNAHKVEATKGSFLKHIHDGGPIMFPILLLGLAALSVGFYKLNVLRSIKTPSQERIKALLKAVARHDKETAMIEAKAVGGPASEMLVAGVEYLQAPRELMEEVMHEVVLSTRLKLNSMLPFLALSATCAPLLGLLGTVTGIITTFGLITVFGSGDPKTLSGGISEALIGTEFGLYVAIPSLLFHAFLSRKVKGVIDQMEKAGVAFINQINKTPYQKINISDLKIDDYKDDGMTQWTR